MQKDTENVPRIDVGKVELDHCNLFNEIYQHDSRALQIFIPLE